jgi:dihydroxyacid dehydratase/phosphogluconate dehydratase
MPLKRAESLRSYRWFGPDDLRSFGHRSRAASMGLVHADYSGKPVIAIINTWSDANPCHSHLRERAEDVKRGVWQAGGFPMEMPAISLGETFQKPTTMMYRNLLAMETEELLRSYPVDGCVLLAGCDKNTPALLMGAISMNLPSIVARKLAGPDFGQWRRRDEVLDRAPRRYHWLPGMGRNRRGCCALSGNLYDDGDRFDDDERC